MSAEVIECVGATRGDVLSTTAATGVLDAGQAGGPQRAAPEVTANDKYGNEHQPRSYPRDHAR